MLLSRWTSYVNNGHGGNAELRKLVKEKGFDYVKENGWMHEDLIDPELEALIERIQ